MDEDIYRLIRLFCFRYYCEYAKWITTGKRNSGLLLKYQNSKIQKTAAIEPFGTYFEQIENARKAIEFNFGEEKGGEFASNPTKLFYLHSCVSHPKFDCPELCEFKTKDKNSIVNELRKFVVPKTRMEELPFEFARSFCLSNEIEVSPPRKFSVALAYTLLRAKPIFETRDFAQSFAKGQKVMRNETIEAKVSTFTFRNLLLAAYLLRVKPVSDGLVRGKRNPQYAYVGKISSELKRWKKKGAGFELVEEDLQRFDELDVVRLVNVWLPLTRVVLSLLSVKHFFSSNWEQLVEEVWELDA